MTETEEPDTLHLIEQVRQELLGLRKAQHGMTIESLGSAPFITGLLGEGDPSQAFNVISRNVLASDLGLSLKSAAASLGLLAVGETHLQRLDDYGAEVGLDQRQVRRYSDNGVVTLAQLIVSTWTTTGVPCLDITVAAEDYTISLLVATRRLLVVEMRPVAITVHGSGASQSVHYPHHEQDADDDWWVRQVPTEPIMIDMHDAETEVAVRVVWRGEMFPKFGIIFPHGLDDMLTFESHGNTCQIRFKTTDRLTEGV